MRSIHEAGEPNEAAIARFAALEAQAANLNAQEARQAALDDLERRQAGQQTSASQGASVVSIRRGPPSLSDDVR